MPLALIVVNPCSSILRATGERGHMQLVVSGQGPLADDGHRVPPRGRPMSVASQIAPHTIALPSGEAIPDLSLRVCAAFAHRASPRADVSRIERHAGRTLSESTSQYLVVASEPCPTSMHTPSRCTHRDRACVSSAVGCRGSLGRAAARLSWGTSRTTRVVNGSKGWP